MSSLFVWFVLDILYVLVVSAADGDGGPMRNLLVNLRWRRYVVVMIETQLAAAGCYCGSVMMRRSCKL